MKETTNLWFNTQEDDTQILDKISSPKKVVKKKASKKSLEERLQEIREAVYKILGNRVNDTMLINTKQQLHDYIDKAIEKGIISVDTETNKSLDPLTCKLMGLCLYTYGQKQAYAPVSHINNNTGLLLENQLTCEEIQEELRRLLDNNVKIVYHNASFDNRVIYCTCNIELSIYWDTQIGCRVLDENDSTGGDSKLKVQYQKHVDKDADIYDIEELFGSVEYEQVPPELFALYAATDSYKTLRLYDYQLEEFSKPENADIFKLFKEVEMPLVKVVKDMELRGIEIDQEYAKRLSEKYHKQVDEYQEDIDKELESLKPQIDAWRLTSEANEKPIKLGKEQKSKNEQLEWPMNLESPTQLAILLYDVLKSPVIDKKYPRGTSAEIMDQMPFNICKLINTRKKVLKLVRDFIDALPQKVNYDNRVHCSFNQYGADTGRFSSSEPNLQQIPSHAKDIRLIFKAKDGYRIIGSDYSGQEPRLTSFMSQDENMINAYKEGKDLYAVIASLSFGYPYEQCLEFNPITGAKQVDGKERRSQAKSILLGVTYGRGAKSIGEQLGKSKNEAQKIVDNFFKAFPKVEEWINKTHESAKKLGYVKDFCGRRRRLPAIQLPLYEFIEKDNQDTTTFNPLLGCSDRKEVVNPRITYYKKQLSNTSWGSQVSKIISEAAKDGITIKSNSNLIAQAERQSVNAIIQGGAATLTKIAMINIANDEILNNLGFRLLITVHDEVLGECPEENSDECAKRLTQVMVDSAKKFMNVPMSCDAYNVSHWYEDEYKAELEKELDTYMKKDKLTRDEALDKLIIEHSESTEEFLRTMFA